MGALHALMQKQAIEKVISSISGFLQLTFLGSKTQHQLETYPRSELTEQILKS